MEPPLAPPSRTTSNEVGTTLLGKYQLGRLLGRGSFAKVYHATSLADGSAVAIKAIDKSQTLAAAMEPRILGEIAAMRRLNPHPNILKIHEVMATKSKIYLVMELARGGELLSQIYRRGRLTEPAARRYFQQLISALRYCHQNGVAHRDVKPQNLLLDHNGNIKVSDFGLSALPEQLKNGLLHTACGTPAYTAPEVIGRKGYDGAKADAWSCGVMLFVFLAGFHPFDDSNLVAMYRKIYRRDFQFPAWISKPARWIISRLLDPNPETRMTIQAVSESSWFKKSLQSPLDISWFNMDLFFVKESRSDPISDSATVMNAFDIISLSSGLDLSGLFDVTNTKKEKRFTSASSKDMIVERVVEIGGKLGYCVQKGKSGSVGLGKGRLVLLIDVLEVAQSLLLVEVKIIGGGVEFDELHWGDLKAGFEDLVLSWQNDEI